MAGWRWFTSCSGEKVHRTSCEDEAKFIERGTEMNEHLTNRMKTPRIRPTRMRAQTTGSEKLATREVLSIWRSAQAVCFDVDSTLIQEESIDELADFLGMGAKVAEVTSRAMSGDMKFEKALELRLSAMQPSRSDVESYLAQRPPQLTTGIPELVARLQERQTAVYLISGGFRDIINPIADQLSIHRSHIFANTLLFNGDGSYAGFDENEFTSRSGGKAAAVKSIRESHGYAPMVMIGDGATDLEARSEGAVELFIGYGGVVERSVIRDKADWYIHEISVLLEALDSQRR